MKRTSHALALTMAASCVTAGSVVLPAAPASASLPVFDPTNYAQNLLQAARALEQVNNQIQSLQNEAAMLRNMGRNLERIDFPQLERVKGALQRIDGLMSEAQAIDFRADQLDRRFRAMFPGAAGEALRSDRRIAAARARLDGALEGFRHSMAVQAQVVENVREDAAVLAELAERSQSAVGSLQAAQATNQLLALGLKQQFQLQTLMASEFRSQGFERARRAQAEHDARAAARRFLGSGRAYSPR
ncbi:MAG TPA: P-type conjugative transfer protein TrbJ [Allosphingosinicella sp.]|jgi:P-type conjugative transfer protein TrbJ